MKFNTNWMKSRHQSQSYSKRSRAPMIEVIENRQLLCGGVSSAVGAGFLGGSVFADGNANAPVAGVTIELYKPGACTPIAKTTTDSHGNYLFNGLQPGNYQIKEVVPCGYTASGTDIHSQLNPATSAGNNLINVTVNDPNQLVVNYNGISSASEVVNDIVKGTAQPNAVGQMKISLGTTAGATNINSGFLTFCVNDLQSLSYNGGESYGVTAKPINQLTDGTNLVSADHAGRVAYLFNHYGNSSLTNIQGAGLQLAIWELLYDQGNTADFNAGNFQVTGPYSPTTQAELDQVISQATSYFNESAGHSEIAAFLDTVPVNPGQSLGLQSVLATCELNFSIHNNTPPPCNYGGGGGGGCSGWNWGSWGTGGSCFTGNYNLGGWCSTSYGSCGSTYSGSSCNTGSWNFGSGSGCSSSYSNYCGYTSSCSSYSTHYNSNSGGGCYTSSCGSWGGWGGFCFF